MSFCHQETLLSSSNGTVGRTPAYCSKGTCPKGREGGKEGERKGKIALGREWPGQLPLLRHVVPVTIM